MSENQTLAYRYREVAVNTAKPLQLVVMLYDAAICSLKEARKHLESKDVENRSRAINRCISVLSELQSCLNLKAGGEIAQSLNQLYDYMKRRIFSANAEQIIHPLNEVEALLDNLRSAWSELVNQGQRSDDKDVASELQNLKMPGAAPAGTIQLKTLNISI
jgi:flagellar secretion chaperone FliS